MTAEKAACDDYFPDNGDLSYDVLHYDLTLDYRTETNKLRARAVLDAVARTGVEELQLDLHGLKVSKVTLDGGQVARFTVKRRKLVVRPKVALEEGRRFRLTVVYGGQPKPLPDGDDEMGWEELADGVLVAGQTNGAPSWFPCNDRPSSKATYRLEITAPAGYYVASNGTLASYHQGAGAFTWVYEQSGPMSTYLATVHIGRYVSRALPGSPVPMKVVMSPELMPKSDAAFGRQPEMMAFFIRRFGPYPFREYTVVVTDDELEIPLEAQTISAFGSNFLNSDWNSERLVAHELAHQWFGNSLTLVTWRDIWLHEGFACYCEWLWSEESGWRTTHEHALEHWSRLAEKDQDLELGNPGPDDMFDDRVYKRGALLLHALRMTIGDQSFFDLLQEWACRHRHGSVTTRMFVDLAEELSGRDLQELFTTWLDHVELPALPP